MYRGRGRGRGRYKGFGISPSVSNEEAKFIAELPTGPPPTYPPVKDLPPLPEIDTATSELLDLWHRLRHVYRSGPYFVQTEKEKVKEDGKKDPFVVRRYSDEEKPKMQRPPLTTVLSLTSEYFPDELSSEKQKKASSLYIESNKTLDDMWFDQLKNEDKEIDKFEELAKKTEEKKGESDEEGNDVMQDAEDDYSGDDYQQGEYFDDDEEYDVDDDADDGPVF